MYPPVSLLKMQPRCCSIYRYTYTCISLGLNVLCLVMKQDVPLHINVCYMCMCTRNIDIDVLKGYAIILHRACNRP